MVVFEVEEGAFDFSELAVADVRVNLRCFAGSMAQQFLNKPEISSSFQKVSGKRMSQGMNAPLA